MPSTEPLCSGPRLLAMICFSVVPAFSQSLECYNYGTYSQCQMPNGGNLTCYNYGGTSSSCEVSHAGSVVSRQTTSSGGGGAGALALLVIWMANKHAEHVTDKAIENASATVILTIKHSIHLMDTSTLVERLAPYLPPEQKTQAEQLTANLAAQSSAHTGAVSNFAANWKGSDRSSFTHCNNFMITAC